MPEFDSTEQEPSGILVRLWRALRRRKPDYDDGPNEHAAEHLIAKYSAEYFPERSAEESRTP